MLLGISLLDVSLPTTLALALVATFGYLFGSRMRPAHEAVKLQARREVKRARAVARELDQIVSGVRDHLSRHQGNLHRFKGRVRDLSGRDDRESTWLELCKEAEEMLRPTLRLASQLATAYDEIRLQSTYLMSFTEVRTDPLTGVSNRRAMDEILEIMFAMHHRFGQQLTVAIFDIDHFKRINDEHGHLTGDAVLRALADTLDQCARETDFVTRYGGEEFVLVMPHTDLDEAGAFCDQIRQTVEASTFENLQLTFSGGVALIGDGEDAQQLLARADAALYQAKAAGRNRIHLHDGRAPRPLSDVPAEAPLGEELEVVS